MEQNDQLSRLFPSLSFEFQHLHDRRVSSTIKDDCDVSLIHYLAYEGVYYQHSHECVATNGHRERPVHLLFSFRDGDGMRGRIDVDVGTQEHPIAEDDLGTVKDRGVEMAEEMTLELDVRSVVARGGIVD